jgi:MFS family permease
VPLSSRRAQGRTAVSLFAGLGAQVGAFAVLIPDLAAARDLTPAVLGLSLAVMAAASIATLSVAGVLADRHGRRPLVLAGTGGFALAFALLATVETPSLLWPTMVLYGIASGCLDLGANAVGSDYERAHDVRAMIGLHAGFSAAAAVLALTAAAVAASAGHSSAYAAMAAGFLVLTAVAARAPLPAHGEAEPPAAAAPRPGRFAVLRVPGVALATLLCTLCFFGDGALEGYTALLLRDVQGSGVLGAGVALAAFHAASLVGRLTFSRVVAARGERWVLTIAGALASAAMAVVVAAETAALAGAALLVVGLALAPIIPTVLSLAGRLAPGRSASAVSVVTSVGYSAFVLGPPVVGVLAEATSLRLALGVVVLSTASIAVLARMRAGIYEAGVRPSAVTP